MVPGDPELGHLHNLCLQLHKTENQNRLTEPRGFLGIHRGAVHGDVWLPTNDLFPVGLAGQEIPRRRLSLT